MKVVGTIDANADDVYELFRDNRRVHVRVPDKRSQRFDHS